LTVEETASSDDLNRLTSHWALVALNELGNSWDEDSGRNVTGVATTLATLGANDINAEVEALLDVLRVTDHVHIEDAVLVELLDDMLGRDTDGGDEETRPRLDHNVDKLLKLALGVVIVGLARIATNLRKEQIDAERGILILQKALEFCNLLLEHVWGVSDTSNDTKTSSICDGGGELRAGSNVHARKQNGVVDLQEIGGDRSDLLWGCHCACL